MDDTPPPVETGTDAGFVLVGFGVMVGAAVGTGVGVEVAVGVSVGSMVGVLVGGFGVAVAEGVGVGGTGVVVSVGSTGVAEDNADGIAAGVGDAGGTHAANRTIAAARIR